MHDDDLRRLLLQLLQKHDRLLEVLLVQHVPTVPDQFAEGRWLNTTEAQALIGCHAQVLREWCRNHIDKKHPGVKRDNDETYGAFWVHESLIPGWKDRYDQIRRRQNGGAA